MEEFDVLLSTFENWYPHLKVDVTLLEWSLFLNVSRLTETNLSPCRHVEAWSIQLRFKDYKLLLSERNRSTIKIMSRIAPSVRHVCVTRLFPLRRHVVHIRSLVWRT